MITNNTNIFLSKTVLNFGWVVMFLVGLVGRVEGQIIAWNFTGGNTPSTNLPGGSAAVSFNTGGTSGVSGCTGDGLSITDWNVNEYCQIIAPTTGYEITTISFNVRSSGSGPGNFKFQYSSTGVSGTFIDLPSGTFTSGNGTCVLRSFDLSSINSLDNNTNTVFRLVFTGGEADGSPATGDAASGGVFRIDDITISGVIISTPCSGNPSPGNTLASSTSIVSGGSTNLSLQTATIGSGVTYQWFSSTVSSTGSWTSISGATNATLTASPTSLTTWYYCAVTCSGNTGNSNPVQINLSYCNPTGSTTYFITNVTTSNGLTNFNNTTTASTGGYGNFSSSFSTSNTPGSSINISITPSTGTNYYYCWIDWNNDLDFTDAGETIFATTSFTSNYSGVISIPSGQAIGTYRMRIANSWSGTVSSACGPAGNGEFEDYSISVVTLSPCSGTPSPGNTLASSTSIVSGGSTNLSLQTATTGSGVTYQWFSSTVSSTGPWTSISGATNATLTASPTSLTTWYYCAVTCSGNTGNSNPVQINLSYCNPTGSTTYFITNITTSNGLTNFNNTTTASTGGYGNFSSSFSTSNTPGSSINISITPSTGTNYYYCWIDWNNDLDFTDVGETIFATTSYTSNYSGVISIPSGQAIGTYRMRIANSWSGTVSSACGPAGNGEFEDYSIIVTSPCSSPSTQASNVNITNTAATSATINWTSGNGNGAIVVLRANATSVVLPSNGTVYTANTNFGAGTGTAITGSGNFVVFVGTGNSVNVTGLSGNTSYTASVYEYNTVDQCFNLTAASNTFTTSCAPFQGTYSVGAGNIAGEDGHYNTLTAAIADYNTRCITGPLLFLLTDPTYSTAAGETFPLTINSNIYASSVNTLTIKPNTGVNSTITANTTTATIVLNGADFVTIDGSNGNTVNSVCPRVRATRNLTVTNTNTANSTSNSVIWFQNNGSSNGATNNRVMNCSIQGSGATTTLIALGSGSSTISTSSLGISNNNNQFINNSVSAATVGIYSVGQSTSNFNTGTAINLNDVSTCSRAGIFVGFENGTAVEGNFINNITASSNDVLGIGVGLATIAAGTTTPTSECRNVAIKGNVIGNIISTGNLSAVGLVIGSSSLGTYELSNNMIYGISGNTTPSDHLTGMHIGGGAATYNIYNNTIVMQGTITPVNAGTISSCIAITNTVYTVNLINNILVNTQVNNSNNTRFTCIALVATSFTNFNSDRNNLFCSGSGSGTYQIGITGGVSTAGTMRTSLSDWQTATNRDLNSFNISPVFVATNDLHLQNLAANTSLNNTGNSLSVITNDIDCDLRSGSPDIGADEFNLVLCNSPSTQASNVNITNTAATSATINWTSGNGNGAIVVLRANATSVVLPSNGTVYTANTNFGAGTGTALTGAGNFVVFVGTGNSVNVTGLSGNTSYTASVYEYNTVDQCYNLTAASNTFTTSCAPFQGTYSVGAGNIAGEDGHYNTLTAAIADYNTRCITGPLLFLLTDPTYSTATGETFPLTINSNIYASSVNTLTIKPNTGVNSTITANTTTATIVLNGADFVTIDGSNGNTVNSVCPRVRATRNLTVLNTNTATTQRAVIWLQTPASTTNGATNNTVRNCIVQGFSSTSTEFGIGSADNTIQSFDVNGGTSHNNNTIENNAVSKVKNGIYSVGKSTSNRNTGTRILLNDVFELSQIGIFTGFEDGTVITANSISDITTTASASVCGIGVGAAFVTTTSDVNSISEGINTVISQNVINNIRVANTYSAFGIVIGKSNTGTTTIRNNMINGIRANGTSSDYCAGIHLGGGTAQINLYHNTISMDGAITGSTPASVTSACVAICNSTFRVDARNNILSNTQTGNTSATVKFTCWAIQGSPNFDQTNKLLTSNFNNLFCAGAGPGSYQIGLTGGVAAGVARTTINNWRTDCAQDANSVNVAPLFVGANDLHLQAVAGNSSLDNTGTPIVSVTNDIDCESRSATTPDIGADEFSITLCTGNPDAGNAAINVASGCASTAITLTATNLSVGGGISYQWQSSPSGLPNTWTNITGATSATFNTSTNTTLFYQLVTTCSNGGGTNTTNTVSFTVTGNPCTCANYPTNYASNTADNDLTSVTVGTMTNNSNCGELAPGAGSIAFRYSNYTGSVTGPSAAQGASVNFSLTENLCPSGTPNQNYFLIYVDWNQDGDFADAGEKAFSQIDSGPSPNVVSTQTVTGSFVVPMTATLGVTRMRVINTTGSFASFNYAQSNPYTTGETEDYCFTVTAASGPSCPNAASIAPSAVQTICQNGTTNQLTATYTTGGVTGTPTPQYQWYSNTTNSNLISTATLIVGETSSTFTPPSNTVGTLYYFCVVYSTDNGCTQTNATQSLASNAVQVTIVDPNTAYNSSDFGTVVQSGSSINNLVISQVYGGGGNSGSTYRNDFIELFNPTSAPISISNSWSVQFASSSTWSVTPLTNVTIPPGGYYLIQQAQGAGGTTSLPTPDATGTIAIGNSSGKVLLATTTTPFTTTCPIPNSSIVDFLGWNTSTIFCFEGTAAAPFTTNTTAVIRNLNGCSETNNNGDDFSSGSPTPRNSLSALNPCVNTAPTTFCQSGTPGAMSVTGLAGGSSYSYQWYERSGLQTCPTGNSTVGWTLIPGANGATYTPSSPITASTTYACLVTINGSPCNATRWANNCVQITIHPNPIPVISGNAALCAGGSLTLSSSSASSYSWTPNGQTTSSITVNSTGTYGVTVTDSNGCTGSASVVVNAAANAVIHLITSP